MSHAGTVALASSRASTEHKLRSESYRWVAASTADPLARGWMWRAWRDTSDGLAPGKRNCLHLRFSGVGARTAVEDQCAIFSRSSRKAFQMHEHTWLLFHRLANRDIFLPEESLSTSTTHHLQCVADACELSHSEPLDPQNFRPPGFAPVSVASSSKPRLCSTQARVLVHRIWFSPPTTHAAASLSRSDSCIIPWRSN